MLMPTPQSRRFTLLLGIAAFVCSGCIECDVLSFLKYDEKTDAFRGMQVFANIRTKDAQELDHLKSLWDRRETLIINPLDFNIFGVTVYERTGRHAFRRFNFNSPGSELSGKTPIDLEPIKIIPGEFYLNKHLHLCFYQQIAMPGKTVDELVSIFNPDFSSWLAMIGFQSLLHDIVQGRKEGAQPLTWEKFRSEIVEILFPDDPTKAKSLSDIHGFGLLEVRSLLRLMSAGVFRSERILRTRQNLCVIVPLSDKDCREVMETIDYVRRTVALRSKAGLNVGEVPPFLEALEARHTQGMGLEVSVNLVKWVRATRQHLDSVTPKDRLTTCISTVAEMYNRGARVNRTFSIEPILAEYLEK